MKCPRNHEMVQLLRTWVCDLCDVERSRYVGSLPADDDQDGYSTVPYLRSSSVAQPTVGDPTWAWEQVQKGMTVEVYSCSCSGKACKGYAYKGSQGTYQSRHPQQSNWRAWGPFKSNPWKALYGHTFKLI